MASIRIPLTPEIQQSAIDAGLSMFLADATTLHVYSSDVTSLQTWLTTNHITTPPTLHKMAHRLEYTPSFTPNAINVPYFTMNQLRAIYNYPIPNIPKYVVGVVSFGGGLYGSVDSRGVLTNGDVQAYWTSIGIAPSNQPKVIIVPINGARNIPNINDGGSTMENTIDVETIGGACPSANLTIILYIAPNTFDQFPLLLNYMYSTNIIVDGVNYKPNLISCSWGAPEIYYGSTLLASINSILTTMSNEGINICTATGDNGSNNGVGGNGNYVDFPSSSPYVTAVGGTTLVCPNNVYDSSTRETAWSTGGGGVSITYGKPSYQSTLTTLTRSIPDVSCVADPNTGIIFTLNGQSQVIGGTSVSAPTFAGLLASINCKTFVNPLLYQAPSSCFHDIISGSNGAYTARSGYDACTGLGSINGTAFLSAISAPVLVTGLTLNSTIVSLVPTQTFQLSVSVAPSSASNKAMLWSSSDTRVATVLNGQVTAIAVGFATITATSTDGSNVSVSARITVTSASIPVTGVTLNQSTLSLHPTNIATLSANIIPSNATNKSVVWSSTSTLIATVNSVGVVTAVSPGTATINATTLYGGFIASCQVTITIPVSSITISPSSFILSTGASKTLTSTILPLNAANKLVTWSTSNPSIATVNSTGVVTASSTTGQATITATTVNMGFRATSTVNVVVGVQSVSLNSSSISLLKGVTFQAVATVLPSNAANKNVTWSSAISSIATVSSTGLITAVGNGTGVISVFTQDGNKTASIIVRVTTAVTSVRLNQTSISLARNTSYQLTPTIVPSTASNQSVTWSSSNTAIASVSSSGLVRAIAIGSAVIRTYTTDGSFQSNCVVTVRA